MKNIFLTIVLISSVGASAQCASESNVYAFTLDGIDYEVVRENKTWIEAAACAVERGGFLARIDSVEENTAVFGELTTSAGIVTSSTTAPDGGGASYVWLGGTDKFVEGRWIWDGTNSGGGDQFWQGDASGMPIGGLYNNWGNEPDDFGSGQDGLGLALTDWPLGNAGEWNDVDTANTLYYLIEYPNTSGIEESSSTPFNYDAENQTIIFENPEKIQELKIYDISGKEVYTTSEINSLQSLSFLENGIFIIQVKDLNGIISKTKISK